jgi:outer membrane receptor protein involved in Fe transport
MKEERMKRGIFFLLGICFIAFTCFGITWAEEIAKADGKKDYQVFDLGEIFVTSEKPPAVQEMAITNEVTAEDIKATNSHTVAEALAFVPGIRVSTGRKNQPMIQIHGMSQSRVLVLIDGVPYYETKFGWLDLNEIPVDNVARIEVSKGNASVLYGPNALMGVVNIITKKPTEKPSAEAIVEVGPHDTQRISLSHGMKVGIFNYWLNYGHQESDGWRLSDNFNPYHVIGTVSTQRRVGGRIRTFTSAGILEDGGYRNNSDYKTDSFWAKVGIDPNPGSEYYVNFHYVTREKGDPPSLYGGQVFDYFPSYFSSVFDRITKYNDWGADLSGQQKVFDQLTFKGKLFYHYHVDDYTSYADPYYAREIAVSRFKDYTLGGSLIADVRPLKWDIIRLSFNYRGDSHKQRDLDIEPFIETFSYTGSLGFENEFNLINNLSIVAGVSYDWFRVTKAEKYSDSNNPYNVVKTVTPDPMHEFAPMMGATYTFTDSTRLFGSVARKVRFPTLDQLYASRGGNLALKPEKAMNYTLGVSQLFSKYAKAELAGFYHDIRDFISRDSNPFENPLALNRNWAKIAMLGFEVNGEFYPMKDLVLRAGYMYNRARDKSPDRVTNYVVNIPAHKIDAGVTYTVPYIRTRLDFNGIYLGKVFNQLPTPASPTQAVQKIKDYYLADLRISQSFLNYFEAYLAVKNIFDKNYESSYGFPAPGRNFYLGITGKY